MGGERENKHITREGLTTINFGLSRSSVDSKKKITKEPGSNGERRERREENRSEVVHLFTFQSREQLDDNEDLQNIHFTNLILLRKGGDVNPDQLMPIRTHVPDDNDFDDEQLVVLGSQECLRQTHIRLQRHSIDILPVEQEYSYDHPREEEVIRENNNVHFLVGRFLPELIDQPYPLDAEGNKIKEFIFLSPEQAQELLTTGSVEIEDKEHHRKKHKILDSLSPNAEDRAESRTETNEEQRIKACEEIMRRFRLAEAVKKLIVLEGLLRGRKIKEAEESTNESIGSVEKKYRTLRKIDKLRFQSIRLLDDKKNPQTKAIDDLIQESEELWRDKIGNYNIDEVRKALHNSNLEAVLNNAEERVFDTEIDHDVARFNPATGEGFPTISLLLPLLLRDNPSIRELRILSSNPLAYKILKALSILKKFRKSKEAQGATTEDLIHKLDEEGLLNISSDREFNEISAEVDTFFTDLNEATQVRIADPLEEVKNASLAELLDIAAGQSPALEGTNDAMRRKIRWEAQRKLILLLLLNDAYHIRNIFLKKGITPIVNLEGSFRNRDKDKQDTHQLTLIDAPYSDTAEGVALKPRVYRCVEITSRPKEIRQVLRKIIVRDQAIGEEQNYADIAMDVFAESYVFNRISNDPDKPFENDISPEECMQREYALPVDPKTGKPFRVTDADGRELSAIKAPAPVADLIYTLLSRANGQVEIIKYKPMPDIGKPIDSGGPGGRGLVRYAKFYIKHTDSTGVVRYREVQIYVPTYDQLTGTIILNGEAEKKRKEADDKRYGASRLFETKNRSLMELLFPATVYGGMQVNAMYKQLNGTNKDEK
ncbi:MAG: hypothetical protein WC752_02385 [Patescibacteria group bacterium]|jgi:hypothetical protein